MTPASFARWPNARTWSRSISAVPISIRSGGKPRKSAKWVTRAVLWRPACPRNARATCRNQPEQPNPRAHAKASSRCGLTDQPTATGQQCQRVTPSFRRAKPIPVRRRGCRRRNHQQRPSLRVECDLQAMPHKRLDNRRLKPDTGARARGDNSARRCVRRQRSRAA